MAKKKSSKLPKTIAGVKVPKQLRKSGGRAVAALKHPLVADLAAAALISAAAALKGNQRVRAAAGDAADKAGDTARGLGAGAASLGTLIAAKAGEGARQLGSAYDSLGAGGTGGGDGSGGAKTKSGKPGKKAKAKKKG